MNQVDLSRLKDQAGARFGLALAPGFLCLLRLRLPGGPGALNQVDLSRLDRCQFGFGGGPRPLVFFRWCPDWIQLSRHQDKTGARFGFGSGSWTCSDQMGASLVLGVARGH